MLPADYQYFKLFLSRCPGDADWFPALVKKNLAFFHPDCLNFKKRQSGANKSRLSE